MKRSQKRRESQQVWDANRRDAGGNLTLDDWRATLDAFGRRCSICGIKGTLYLAFVVKGGGATKRNCVPVCLAHRHWPVRSEYIDRFLAQVGGPVPRLRPDIHYFSNTAVLLCGSADGEHSNTIVTVTCVECRRLYDEVIKR